VCGRYSLAGADARALRDRFGLGERVVVRRRFNVAPGDDVLAVTTDRDGVPRGDVLRWGLVPHWAGDPGLGARMINARAETVADKPAFRDAFARRRCLVVADGFFEWERPAPGARGPKQAWWVTRADGMPFAFAGLWATWRPEGSDAEALRTCAIVTTDANSAVAGIHDRMPVILPAGAESAWLDRATPPAALRGLLVPLPETDTAMRRVGPAVNDARHDEPDCLDPPAPAPHPAPTLF
jgi:putative SOS response-associated peptidase YedK